MGERWGPVLAGVAAGLLAGVLPDVAGVVVVLGGAFLAGWLLAREPLMAAALFLLPGLAVGVVLSVLDSDGPGLASFVVAAGLAVAFTAIFTHLGAGVALRSRG